LLSIVTDEYVYLSVCLLIREDISGTTRAIFPKIFVHVAYVRGLVVLRHLDDTPHRVSVGRVGQECTVRTKCTIALFVL